MTDPRVLLAFLAGNGRAIEVCREGKEPCARRQARSSGGRKLTPESGD